MVVYWDCMTVQWTEKLTAEWWASSRAENWAVMMGLKRAALLENDEVALSVY